MRLNSINNGICAVEKTAIYPCGMGWNLVEIFQFLLNNKDYVIVGILKLFQQLGISTIVSDTTTIVAVTTYYIINRSCFY